MQKQSAPATPPNRLRELREEHGLKLYDIAALFRVDQSTVNRWERGETATIPDDVKLALADRYEVTVEYLMRWDQREPGQAAA